LCHQQPEYQNDHSEAVAHVSPSCHLVLAIRSPRELSLRVKFSLFEGNDGKRLRTIQIYSTIASSW
jgi:hypothetical protein